MTSSIPESVSFSDLQGFLDKAKEETPAELFDGKTIDEVADIANQLLTDAFKHCGHPMLHKMMAMGILQNLGSYLAQSTQEAPDEETAAMRWTDVGTLRSAHQLLTSVAICENDIIANPDDDSAE